VLDAGNLLARNGRVTDAAREGMEMKGDLILRTFAEMGIDAMTVGGGDLAFGVDWLTQRAEQLELPYVCANLTDEAGTAIFPAHRMIDAGEVKVGVFGITGTVKDCEGCAVTDAAAAATAAVAALQADGAHVIVALSQQKIDDAVELAEAVPGIDFVISGQAGRRNAVPGLIGETPTYLFRSPTRGRQLAVLSLTFAEGGKGYFDPDLVEKAAAEREKTQRRIERLGQQVAEASSDREAERRQRSLDRVIDEAAQLGIADISADGRHTMSTETIGLGKKVADDPAIAAIVEETTAKLPAEPKSDHAKRARPKVGEFAGASQCRACHQGIYRHWRASDHARAYTTLAREQKQSDTACYYCHITGFYLEGGPRAVEEVSYLRNVQCEACHGASAKHVAEPELPTPLKGKIESTCDKCHNETAHGGEAAEFTLASAMETIKCEDKPLEGMPDGIQPLRLGPVPTASQPPAAATRK
jgi:hypothetical protein